MAPPQQQLTTATLDPVPARQVDDVPVAEEMSDSFLAYALSVITSRAIPDVRDGLKPVQRRVLWSMLQMGLRPGTPYRKSARVVGDTMGRYHPHGDAAIYDTLVRMGQDFSRMVALVDPQGNFGSLDDPPAASRYTECRLSEAAMDMVGELDEDTVDFRPTYDGEDTEPVVLPAALPNLLVNGTAGIAVGMATNMLPHNLAEVGEAIELVMSKQPGEAATEPSRKRRSRPTTDELMEVVPGPDFPGGGTVVADNGLRAAYDCGRGSVRVRARTSIESITRRRQAVIVTELPHLVGPERVVSRITELAGAGRLTGVSGIADLSDMDGLRLQIDLKPGSDPSTVLGELYRHTPLEESLSVNNVVLVDGVPTTVGLRELCEHYVAHRLQVVVRRTRHRLRRADERLHIVDGLIAALDNIDEVVALIRGSRDATEARAGLTARFGLTEIQATHILDMALRRLTALERERLDAEAEGLRADIADFKETLASNRRQRAFVRKELRRIVDDHGRPRR
ncbi:MAG: DNA topoisomerase IV, partial [Acidimicrobiaceae bacterium]|nr:DNA topoisomerase IV [Acidimicrobiaceae bacterium]